MLDFGALPPEINSGLMYAGPGPGSMLTAAAAWQSLAEELTSAASGYGSILSTLTSGPWTGPTSIAMAAGDRRRNGDAGRYAIGHAADDADRQHGRTRGRGGADAIRASSDRDPLHAGRRIAARSAATGWRRTERQLNNS